MGSLSINNSSQLSFLGRSRVAGLHEPLLDLGRGRDGPFRFEPADDFLLPDRLERPFTHGSVSAIVKSCISEGDVRNGKSKQLNTEN